MTGSPAEEWSVTRHTRERPIHTSGAPGPMMRSSHQRPPKSRLRPSFAQAKFLVPPATPEPEAGSNRLQMRQLDRQMRWSRAQHGQSTPRQPRDRRPSPALQLHQRSARSPTAIAQPHATRREHSRSRSLQRADNDDGFGSGELARERTSHAAHQMTTPGVIHETQRHNPASPELRMRLAPLSEVPSGTKLTFSYTRMKLLLF